MSNKVKDEKRLTHFDIIFWGHAGNGIDRYLPLMAGLKTRGFKPLLFYQDYDYKDGLSRVQKRIISRHELEVMDYSFFMKKNFLLKIITFFLRAFRRYKITLLCDKARGLRSRIIKYSVTEKFIKNVLSRLKPKIGFFDNIFLEKYASYPYGSYYIKKISDELKMKSFSICHGGTVHMPKTLNNPAPGYNYDKIYEPNEYEKEWDKALCVRPGTQLLPLGDPRFDSGWKEDLKRLLPGDQIKNEIQSVRFNKERVILYLCSNLGNFNMKHKEYEHLEDIIRLTKELKDAALLIKQHPRYKDEKEIKKIMRKNNFCDFFVIEDDPLVCYLDHVDYVITSGTTALQDILPEGHRKIVIYDDFADKHNLINIFREDLNYFNSYESLSDFFKRNPDRAFLEKHDAEKEKRVLNFCKKWVANGKELDTIVKDITDDICRELEKVKE